MMSEFLLIRFERSGSRLDHNSEEENGRRNIGAVLEKSFCNCLRNPSGSDIRPVAVEMSDMLEQCKEVVEEMTRKVAEFLEANMGMVGNNLEEGWGNLVEEYFSGDDVAALQVIMLSYSHGIVPEPLKPH